MTGKIMPLRARDTSTVQAAVDAFLSSPRYANPNTRRGYTGVLDRLLAGLGASRPLAEVSGEELAGLLEQLWGAAGPGDLEPQSRRRGRLAVLVRRQPAARPGPAGQRRTAPRAPQRYPRGVPPGDRAGAVPSWRAAAGEDPVPMLYEIAARASEVLALDIEDLDLDARRAPIRSKGGDTEWICWGSGTAHLRPRLIRGRPAGPVFLSERRPGPARRAAAKDLCPATGRARLGYDRARILFTRYTGWDLHQLRHSAATHLGEQGIPLQLIMAKTRHRNPRTRCGTSAQAPKPSLRSPPCSNPHVGEAE
jgi:integrase